MVNQFEALRRPLANVLDPLSEEHLDFYQEGLTETLGRYGLAENFKQIACGRLAGLLVIVASLGELPKEIFFEKTLDIPESWTAGIICEADYLSAPINEQTDSLVLLRAIFHLQGGKAGEAYINFYHPVSLLEDMYISTVCTLFLANQLDSDLQTVSKKITEKAIEILDLNADIYNELFKLLEENTAADITTIRRMLSAVPLADIKSILGRGR